MTRVLVTGGRGTLGRPLAKELASNGHEVRIMSRTPAPAVLAAHTEWAQADVLTGHGLAQAAEGIDVVIHAASSPFRKELATEVDGTRRLLDACKTVGVKHVIYVSIVGIDRFPFSYYQAKLKAERLIAGYGLPYSIQRATQFHTLINIFLSLLSPLPFVALIPTGFKFQPIAPGEVAHELALLVNKPPAGMLPDIGGPEVLTLGELAQAWFRARGQHKLVIPMRLPGATANGFRNGYNTCPDRRIGKQTWEQWLAETRVVKRHELRGSV